MVKYLLIITLLFNCVETFAQDKTYIAVLDLDGEGLTKSETKIISSRLRTDLINTNKFIVIEREKVDEILKEQGFQLSGCTSNECVVEVGKLIGVKQIIAGSIGKIGKLYTLSIRLIDVETGEVLKTATADCECSIETVLLNSVKNVVQIISGESINTNTYRHITEIPEYDDEEKLFKSNTSIKEWEKIGLSKKEYIEFINSHMSLPEWKKFKSSGMDIMNWQKYKTSKMPMEVWREYVKSGLSISEWKNSGGELYVDL